MSDIRLIDLRTCELTMSQLRAQIVFLKKLYPDHEVFMDGDAYAVVATPRRV